MAKRFEDLEVWKLAREVTKLIYGVSSGGTFSRDFALVNQIRRASISIVSNIAEGFERNGDKEFSQFLAIAKGSCGEVRAQLYVALDQNYIDEKEFALIENKLIETSRTLSGLMKYLQQSELRGSKFR
ncbi:MAG: four helix bundle protein [Acidobacteria bacterium]|nr:four helix bundle protein [Acidobacteriota bacterium]MCA1637032.1 four helix bundle protein [Acidobacteriota bacterium]